MAELGSGTGSSYPGALDTDNTQEVNSPNAGRTKARAEVINDLNSAIVAIETELGTDPAGVLTDVKTYLQTEHGTDGTHLGTKVVRMTTNQTGIAGTKAWAGTQTWAKGADVASANALTLGTDGNSFDITGTTAITSITTLGIGTTIILQFDGILTFTHHATNLILPTGANITTAAGDIAVMYEYGVGTWRCVSYSRANGTALGTAIPAADSVTEAMVNWANAGGISQSTLDFYTPYSTGVGAINVWTTIKEFKIYIPTNATSLEYIMKGHNDTASSNHRLRLNTDTNDGTEFTTPVTTSAWSSALTLSIADKSGWTTVNLQYYNLSAASTITVDNVSYRII